MRLTEKVFQSIFGLCIIDPGGDNSERREAPRVEFGRRALIIPLRDGVRQCGETIIVRDMSIKGVGILRSERFAIGEQFILDVSKFAYRPLGLRCAVERCEPGGSGGTQFVIGGTFEEMIESPEQLIPGAAPVVIEKPPRKRWRPLAPAYAKLAQLLCSLKKWLPARRGATTPKRLTIR